MYSVSHKTFEENSAGGLIVIARLRKSISTVEVHESLVLWSFLELLQGQFITLGQERPDGAITHFQQCPNRSAKHLFQIRSATKLLRIPILSVEKPKYQHLQHLVFLFFFLAFSIFFFGVSIVVTGSCYFPKKSYMLLFYFILFYIFFHAFQPS